MVIAPIFKPVQQVHKIDLNLMKKNCSKLKLFLSYFKVHGKLFYFNRLLILVAILPIENQRSSL